MDKCVVYFHLNPQTKKVFYVGIGSIKRAFAKSKCRTKHWANYVKKYGEPIVEIVHETDSVTAAIMEKIYIKFYGRIRMDKNGILVNKSIGGERTALGFKHTKEAREKISEAGRKRVITDEFRKKISLIFKGRKHTEESKKKSSIANSGVRHPQYGKPKPESTKRKIGEGNKGKPNAKAKQVINTITKEVFKSAMQVRELFFKEKSVTYLSAKLKGIRSNDTDFQYVEDFNAGKIKFVNNYDINKPKKIMRISDGAVFDSQLDASRKTGKSAASIKWQIDGKLKNKKVDFKYL